MKWHRFPLRPFQPNNGCGHHRAAFAKYLLYTRTIFAKAPTNVPIYYNHNSIVPRQETLIFGLIPQLAGVAYIYFDISCVYLYQCISGTYIYIYAIIATQRNKNSV